MPTSWIVQDNLPKSQTAWRIRGACEELGLPFYPINVTARSSEPPLMPDIGGPFVLHGGTTFILHALNDNRWRRGLFFDPAGFRHSQYAQHYGSLMLNETASIRTWDSLLHEVGSDDEQLFVKPNDDLKHFTGAVLSRVQLRKMDGELRKNGVRLDLATEVVVAAPVEVDAEWRLFLVESRVVSGSMYRPTAEPALPEEAVQLAERAAQRWAPAPVFVMDVARANGAWKIVECDCFNGSGFYVSDVERVISAVSSYQQHRLTS